MRATLDTAGKVDLRTTCDFSAVSSSVPCNPAQGKELASRMSLAWWTLGGQRSRTSVDRTLSMAASLPPVNVVSLL